LRSRDFYKHVEGLADFLLVQSVSRHGRTDLWHPGWGAGGTMFFITEEHSSLPGFRENKPSVENFESHDPKGAAVAAGLAPPPPAITCRG
jgi:hypothetical protein